MSKTLDIPKHGIFIRLIVFYIDILQEFLRSTTLHSVKYLAFKYLIFLERMFFFVCFVAAIYSSMTFAVTIIEKWQTSPVLIIMNPDETLVVNDPFPAITICNMNQASRKKVKDYPVYSSEYAMLQKICYQELNYTFYAKSDFHKTNDTFANLITRSAQSCEDMVVMCRWGLDQTSCTDLFREVLLDEGICCSFNIAHPFYMYKGEHLMVRDFTSIDSQWIPVDWHLEKGYPKDLPNHFYPRKSLGQGMTNGLSLVLNGNINDYYCSSTNSEGFKVQLHNAIDAPQIRETGLTVSLGYQTNFRINAFKDEALNTLRSVRSKDRQCYFSDEHPLKYYHYYTRRNCESECEADFFLRKCNCIPYYLPFIVTNVTVCYIEHFDCLVEAEKDTKDDENVQCKIECLSGCHDLFYMPDAFATPLAKESFDLDNVFLRNFTTEYIKDNVATISIFFPQNYYRSNIKTPYTGITEYLSQTGGIMGLMMGFSIISVVEFIYFFVMKPLILLGHKFFNRNIVNIQRLTSTDIEVT